MTRRLVLAAVARALALLVGAARPGERYLDGPRRDLVPAAR